MAATFSSKAEAVIIGGYDFGLVTNPGIYSAQVLSVPFGYGVASLAILNSAELAAGGLTDLQFLSQLMGFPVTSPAQACGKSGSCQYRLSDLGTPDPSGGTSHSGLFLNGTPSVSRNSVRDSLLTTPTTTSALYLLYYKKVETPEPSMSLLLGGGLMGLGYLAYRRKGR